VSVEQLTTDVRQRVVDDLVVAARSREPSLAECAEVVTDQVLRATGDPAEIADAQLVPLAKRERDQQTSWIA
jgi:hypothetical protein